MNSPYPFKRSVLFISVALLSTQSIWAGNGTETSYPQEGDQLNTAAT